MFNKTLTKNNHFVLILLLSIGIGIYFPSIFNNFVWLDNSYIVNNQQLQNLNILYLLNGSSLTMNGFYRPLSALYLVVVYKLFLPYSNQYMHLFQIILSVLNAFLLYAIFSKFCKKYIALFLAILYLVHPLNQFQTVYISASSDVLYLFFGLLGFIFCLNNTKEHWKNAVITSVLLFMSMLSKESGILFLGSIYLYILFFARYFIKKYTISFIILIIFYFVVRYMFHGFAQVDSELFPMAQLTLMERLINIPEILFYYLYHFIYPINISGFNLNYINSISINHFYYPLLFDTVFFLCYTFFGIIIYTLNKSLFKYYCFFTILFIASLCMYIQIVPLDYAVSSNWFAFPMIGLLGALGVFANSFTRNKINTLYKYLFVMMAIALLSVLSIVTWNANKYWKNDIALFNYFSQNNDNLIIEAWLANAYLDVNDYSKAVWHINKSLSMAQYDNNLTVAALILEQMGKLQEAKQTAFSAMNADNYGLGKHAYSTYVTLIKFFYIHGDISPLRSILYSAVEDYPDESFFWTVLAQVELQMRNIDKAKIAIEKAHAISPNITQVKNLYSIIHQAKL